MFGWLRKPTPENTSPAAQWAVASMSSSPEEWTFSSHYLTHAGGATVWIGNWDLVWSRRLALPGFGEVVPEGRSCVASADNRLLHNAVAAFREEHGKKALTDYIANSSKVAAERLRQRAEEARRAKFSAESLRLEADRLERRAAELTE